MVKSEASVDSKGSWADLLTPTYFMRIILLSVAILVPPADSMMVTTMAPTIVEDIGGVEYLPWLVALYQLGGILASVVSAKLAIRYGILAPKSLAAFCFASGCLLSVIAPSMPVMLVGRLLQGLGGGGLITISFIATMRMFPPALVPRVMAITSGTWGVSAFLGPLLGGIFVQYATWRFGFGLFAVLAILIAVVVPRMGIVDQKTGEEPLHDIVRNGVWRLLFLSIGIFGFLFVGSVQSMGLKFLSAAIGISFLVAFFVRDSKAGEARFLPLPAFGLSTKVSAGLTAWFCFTAATVMLTAYGPFFLENLHHTSALVAGYVVASVALGWSSSAIFISGLKERYDGMAIFLGLCLSGIGALSFIYAVPNGPVWLIAVVGVFVGSGFGITWSFLLRRIKSFTDGHEADRATGALTTVQRMGYAIGAAWAGIAASSAGLTDGVLASDLLRHAAFWIFFSATPFIILGLVAARSFVGTQK